MSSRDSEAGRRRSERGQTAKAEPRPTLKENEEGEREHSDESLGDDRDEKTLRSKLESMVPDVVKKAMVSGLGALFVTEETIRSAVTEMRLPKEAAAFLMQQADNTKDQLFRHIARELREYLEKADLSKDLPNLLANMKIEVKTEIRFIPDSDNPPEDQQPAKPQAHSEIDIKSHRRRS